MPRVRQRVALGEPAAEHAPRLRVRELHGERAVDRDDAFMQPLEQRVQPVALALDVPERAAQLPPHPVEVLRERTELVAEAVAQRRVEVSGGDRLCCARQAAQPERDELREHEPDEHADHACDHAGAERLVVLDADRGGDVRPVAQSDERAAASPAARSTYTPPSFGAAAEVPAGERGPLGVALERRLADGALHRRARSDELSGPVVEP